VAPTAWPHEWSAVEKQGLQGIAHLPAAAGRDESYYEGREGELCDESCYESQEGELRDEKPVDVEQLPSKPGLALTLVHWNSDWVLGPRSADFLDRHRVSLTRFFLRGDRRVLAPSILGAADPCPLKICNAAPLIRRRGRMDGPLVHLISTRPSMYRVQCSVSAS